MGQFRLIPKLNQFARSVWFFPALLTLLFVSLVSLSINGSSIGVYYEIFNGSNDSSLLQNNPQGIRSDEWAISSPITFSQEHNDYNPINNLVGNGEDVSLVGDIPYKDWSSIFKPHNLGFFFMSFDNAFSFRWWLMAYLLILGAYFFIYLFLPLKFPKKTILAALLSSALFFSPFIQWWYLYGTIAPIAYSLMGMSAFMLLLRAKNLSTSIALGAFISYIAVCFCLVLYPPFQIPCAIVLFVTTIAIFLNHKARNIDLIKHKIFILLASVTLALATVGLFLYQHKDTVEIIGNTAYPGHRVSESGTLPVKHFLASHLSRLFTEDERSSAYGEFIGSTTNQSEASSFILLLPFTVVVLAITTWLTIKKRKDKPYISIAVLLLTALFSAWLFIPGLDILGKITLLDKVPPVRLIIGVGLLNFIALVELIRVLAVDKHKLSMRTSTIVAATILLFYLAFNIYTSNIAPEFIGYKWAILLAIPVPLISFLLLRKMFVAASLVFFAFSFLSTYQINPLYRGTDSIRNSRLAHSIRDLSKNDDAYWVSENMISANLITMSGAKNLSGTYFYPQNGIWEKVDNDDSTVYNRYANVLFMFDRDENAVIEDNIKPIGTDQFWVEMEPCSQTLKSLEIGYIVTASPFSTNEAPCLEKPIKEIVYPRLTFFIYKID